MPLIGYIDNFMAPRHLSGWALDESAPDAGKAFVLCYRNDRLIGVTKAEFHRPDLLSYGNGNYGFFLECSENILEEDIFGDRVRIVASNLEGDTADLAFHPPILERMRPTTVLGRLNALPPAEAADILAEFNRDRLPAATHDASPLRAPVGYLSIDRTVLLGRDGCLFLVGGTNNVVELYDTPPHAPEVADVARRWVALMQARAADLKARGIQYLQMILPEKQSVLPALYPYPPLAPTPFLSRVEDGVAGAGSLAAHYLSGLRILLRHPAPVTLLRGNDSHLSPRGAYEIAKNVLRTLGFESTETPSFSETRLETGDIGLRLFGVPLYEDVLHPATLPTELFSGLAEPTLTASHTPEEGRHLGTLRSWSCPDAPIPLRVVAFANSFFAWGTDPNQLSWWFARCFKEFHFLWSPTMDIDMIESLKPDVVICQTIERFLKGVPER